MWNDEILERLKKLEKPVETTLRLGFGERPPVQIRPAPPQDLNPNEYKYDSCTSPNAIVHVIASYTLSLHPPNLDFLR